ncbi:MAG: UDP-3-O-(3-hydroxymyristoyl)glucosamine N-acyltransferase [Planctomycetota bacterium]
MLGTTRDIADRLGAELRGREDIALDRVDAIEHAGARALTFVREPSRLRDWVASESRAVLVSLATLEEAGEAFKLPDGRALIVVPDADLAVIVLLDSAKPDPHQPDAGAHASAVIDSGATIGDGVRIGPHAVVGPGCVLGDGVVLHAGVVLGASVRVGRGTRLRSHVVVEDDCIIGDGCEVHPNVVIGGEGFGYHPAPDGRGVLRIPHVGNVEIGHAVEIGAGTTIDRGKFGPTRIGDGTKIDNLVQIGHGCRIGCACIICGQVGLAGSVTLGDGVTLAGNVGVADNISIGAGATVAGKAGVMNDIPAGETWGGFPAMPIKDWFRNSVGQRRLSDLVRAAKALTRGAEAQ